MVRPIGDSPQSARNEEIASVKVRALANLSERVERAFPLFKKGVGNDTLYQQATSKKGVTASVFKRFSIDVQTSNDVSESPSVFSVLKKAGKQLQQQTGKPTPKRHKNK